MATLVLSAVGNAVGGPVGAAIGAFVGSKIDRAVFTPGGARSHEGPRLADLAVQASSLGAPIPVVFGSARIAGNVLWSTGLVEKRSETRQSSGGKGGKPSTTSVTFSYSVSLAVGLSARVIRHIRRIWADGKLLRDSDGNWLSPATIRVYPGEEIQNPDPLIEAHEGFGNTPAFRGLAYVVLENLELAEFANRVPNLSFEVVADTALSLADLLHEIPSRVGLMNVEVDGLATPITGLAIGRDTHARGVMDAVLSTFPVSISEGSGKLRMRAPGADPVRMIAESDLGAVADGEDTDRFQIRIEREQGGDLLQELELHYGDPARDYQPAIQRARRQQDNSDQRGLVETPLYLSAVSAKHQVEELLALNWLGQVSHHLQLPVHYADLEVGDRISYAVAGRSIVLMINEMSIEADRILLSGHPLGTLPFTATNSAASGFFAPPIISPVGETQLEILDLPGLGGDKGGPHIVAASSGTAPGWKGSGIYVSRDAGESYDLIATNRAGSVMGTVLVPPDIGPHAYWDETQSLDVRLIRPEMSLESRSRLGVLNGANLAVVGDEIIQFREAFLEPDGRYHLRGLLRGRGGTEWAMTTHQPGERFILLDGGGLMDMDVPLSSMGQPILTKAVSINKTLDETPPETFTYRARALMPLSPVHVRASRTVAGDLALSWMRRGRIGGAWIDGSDVPLGEETEEYQVDILKAGQPVRTISVTKSQAIYNVDHQVADFGVPVTAVDVAIYQISTLVGRGFAFTGTL